MGKPRVDITGQPFGLLKAIEPTGETGSSGAIWRCECRCGGEKNVGLQNLKRGKVKSCGCMKNGRKMEDLSDQEFGYLKAIEPTDKRSSGSVIWRCECICGAIHEVPAEALKRGLTKSCGCKRYVRQKGKGQSD